MKLHSELHMRLGVICFPFRPNWFVTRLADLPTEWVTDQLTDWLWYLSKETCSHNWHVLAQRDFEWEKVEKAVAPHSCIINAKPCEQSINYDGLSINWKPIGLHQTQSFRGDALIGVNKTNNESFGLSRIHQRLIGSKKRRVQLSTLIPG